MENKMTSDEFIKFLINNKWWDENYFYQFNSEAIHLENSVEFNEGLVMVVFKHPKNGDTTAIGSYYRVLENEDGSLKMYLNSKYGVLSIKEHSFTVKSEDSTTQTISQYIVI